MQQLPSAISCFLAFVSDHNVPVDPRKTSVGALPIHRQANSLRTYKEEENTVANC